MAAVALRALSLLAAPVSALAHPVGAADAVAGSVPGWASWNTAPWLLGLLAMALGLYATGVRRLWIQAGCGRGLPGWQVAAWVGGWATLVVALVSPLDALGGWLFSAHMLQHELLMVVAAPLLVLGRPLAAWTWASPPAGRQAIGRASRAGWVQAGWRQLCDPVVAWALHALVLWAWHLPGLFTAALLHPGLHVLQHASFLASALLFWWAVLGGDPRAARRPVQAVAWLFTTMLHTAALGALLSLAPTVWYAPYLAATPALGLDALQDQQLGGLVMWVPAGLAYVAVALALLARLLRRQGA